MNRARMRDEVLSCPWIAREEFRWQQIAFEAIARTAGQDDVTLDVRAAVR